MFLTEPAPTPYDVRFNVAGVPVRVHPFFWLMAILLKATQNPRPDIVLIWTVAVFVSILVHELGHAALIRYFGWRPHVVLYAFGGLAVYEPTWRRTWPQIAIALAGPMAGFLLAAVVVLGILLAGHAVRFDVSDIFSLPIRFELFRSLPKLNLFLSYMLFVNFFWGLLNLLPIYPLDGGRIAQELLRHWNPADGMRQSLIISIAAAGGMAIIMYVKLHDLWAAFMFGYLAFINYQVLDQFDRHYRGRGW